MHDHQSSRLVKVTEQVHTAWQNTSRNWRLHKAQISAASLGTYVQSFAINLHREISPDIAGKVQRDAGEVHRKIDRNFEKSESLAMRADRASK